MKVLCNYLNAATGTQKLVFVGLHKTAQKFEATHYVTRKKKDSQTSTKRKITY